MSTKCTDLICKLKHQLVSFKGKKVLFWWFFFHICDGQIQSSVTEVLC